MSLTEPRIFSIHFFGELDSCGKAAEEIKRVLSLEPRDKNPTSLLQDFLKGLISRSVSNDEGLLDTPCEFSWGMNQVKVRYYPKGEGKTGTNGIYVLTTTLNSGPSSMDVAQGWQELKSRLLPAKIPNGLLDPITVYHAVSDKELGAHEVMGYAESLDLHGDLKKAQLSSGSLYQLGTVQGYLLFSTKENEDEARRFATLSLPLLNLYFYSGDVRMRDKGGTLDAARSHMQEVSEGIKNKLNDYSSKGFGTITTEAERKDIFEITKGLWLLNNHRSKVLNLLETVNVALCNFRTLKERLIAFGPEEIFCQKEKRLELQKAQLQADAAYLHNTFESGRVVLDSIEDHMELEYTRELKESNKKALSLQSAAFIIEFAIVYYYFLGSWHYILGEKFYEFPTLARLLCATSIASLLSAGTHLFAKWRMTKKRYYFYSLLGLLPLFLCTIGYIAGYSIILHK